MSNYIKLFILLMIVFASCKYNNARTDYAIQWTKDIKEHILADINVVVDSISIDSSKDVI